MTIGVTELKDHGSDTANRNVYTGPILPDVILEHLEEFAFLSLQRRKLLFASDVPLDHFKPHDDRINAHWDGLVVGRPTSIELAKELMQEPDPWDVYSAARVWLELGEPDSSELIDLLGKMKKDSQPSWREALRRIPPERLQELLPKGPFASDLPSVQSIFIFAWGWHGLLTKDKLAEFARSEDASVRRSAARAAGWGTTSPAESSRFLQPLRGDSDPEVRRAALWSSALINPSETESLCREEIRYREADPFTVRVLGLLGNPTDAQLLQNTLKAEKCQPAVVRALGDLGNMQVLPWLIELIEDKDKQLSLAANDALRKMLGEIQLGESESGVDSESEDDFARSHPEAIKEFCAQAMRDYDLNFRWLRGKPFPWSGPIAEEPMEALWRSSIIAPRLENAWLRNEVPDGFFTALPDSEAMPGE